MYKSVKEKLLGDRPVVTAIECLNNPRPEKIAVRNKLAELVAIWQAAERDYKLIQLAWEKEARRFIKNGGRPEDMPPAPPPRKLILPPGCPTFNKIEKDCRVSLSPIGSRDRPIIHYVPGRDELGQPRALTDWEEAAFLFVPMYMFSDPDHLGGPCPHCGRFFLKTRRTKLFCTQKCASVHTAKISTRKRREMEHKQKLALTRRTIKEWRKSGQRRSWQEFVLAKNPEITARWLTRVVNTGELTPPSSVPRR